MKRYNEVFADDKIGKVPNKKSIGIDIGSRQSKAILLADGNVYTALIQTGFLMKDTVQELLDLLFKESGLEISDIDYIVGTGYGRIALEFETTPNRIVTEISCHGLGAHYLGKDIKTIIDIGGQDSKVIRIDPEDGRVTDFVMNDKCAAGTGRFLEKTANILGFEVTEIGEISLKAQNTSNISSQCVVFAESEIISGRAKGEDIHELAAGIHVSVARRINNLLNRVGFEQNVLFTGGVSSNVGMRKTLENLIGFPLETSKLDTVYAGALGAAIFAGQYANEKVHNAEATDDSAYKIDLTDLRNAVEKQKEDYIKKQTGTKANVAYLCVYTPLEILSSANVSHFRMLHAGNSKEVAAGEVITQSIFCDFTKSCLGGFSEENLLYSAIDKVYTFYTCDCMKSTAEAINDHYVPASVFNLPRLSHSESSKDYYVTELRAFIKDLEKITKEKIDDSEIRKNVVLYNQAREYLKKISSFRKAEHPILTSTEFQEIAFSYYYLPVNELLIQLQKIVRQLEEAKVRVSNKKTVRLMIVGGIIAEGDNKVTRLIEEEVGAKIVVEDNCTGYSPFTNIIPDKNGDIVNDIANSYLTKTACARMKPLADRIDFSANLAKEYNVDGIIYYYLKFCPCYGIAKNEFIHKFQELNIPVLEVPCDYSKGDEGQIKTRIDAFVEVLEER